MASVFLYHVVGDLTVGKPVVAEFHDGETVESAIQAIGESTEGGIPVWKKRSAILAGGGAIESSEMRQQRFVGILNSLDIVAFLARSECLDDQEKVLKTPVSEVIVPNSSVLRQVDPATRLIDALEMMKHGVKRLLVRKSVGWKGMSKRFSILYNGKWLKNMDGSTSTNLLLNPNRPSKTPTDQFCCLSREDVLRFIIGCLGALAPLPLSSISSLGAINPSYYSVEASCQAADATRKLPEDPSAIAVVEQITGDQYRIIGEISASKLWRCDHLAAAWALANLSAGRFVMGVEENADSSPRGGGSHTTGEKVNRTRLRRFSNRSIGFDAGNGGFGSMYRGRSAPLTCKVTSSLAAVMAQMLSHRATHVWVVDDENDDEVLVGVVGYADILGAVSKPPSAMATANRSCNDGLVSEIQN